MIGDKDRLKVLEGRADLSQMVFCRGSLASPLLHNMKYNKKYILLYTLTNDAQNPPPKLQGISHQTFRLFGAPARVTSGSPKTRKPW